MVVWEEVPGVTRGTVVLPNSSPSPFTNVWPGVPSKRELHEHAGSGHVQWPPSHHNDIAFPIPAPTSKALTPSFSNQQGAARCHGAVWPPHLEVCHLKALIWVEGTTECGAVLGVPPPQVGCARTGVVLHADSIDGVTWVGQATIHCWHAQQPYNTPTIPYLTRVTPSSRACGMAKFPRADMQATRTKHAPVSDENGES